MDIIDINNPLAYAWDRTQGPFSENIARKILNFEKIQGLKINKVLDICFGSGNLMKYLSESGKYCVGIETSEEFYNYVKSKYPNLEVYKKSNMFDLEGLGKFDLITCNHDMLNNIQSLEIWKNLFQKIYDHLSNGGIFIFDYYSKNRIKNWNETNFTENFEIDVLREITSNEEFATILNNFYIHLPKDDYSTEISNSRVKKVEDVNIKYAFDNKQIFDLIKDAKFRYMISTDANFTPLPQTVENNRVRIIAIKRETVIK